MSFPFRIDHQPSSLPPFSSPASLSIKRQRLPRPRRDKRLVPRTRHLGQPPNTPQTLLTLRLRRHALPPLQRPNLNLAIVPTA